MRDPVCGKILTEADVKAKSHFLECWYYFCSTECKHKFDGNQRGYLSESALGA
jgi:YHS domain-containing protein